MVPGHKSHTFRTALVLVVKGVGGKLAIRWSSSQWARPLFYIFQLIISVGISHFIFDF